MSAFDEETEVLRLLKKTVECPICLASLRNPKTLPCGHTYCDLCIMNMKVLPPTRIKKVKCALCNTISPVPKTGYVVSYVIKGE
jgi:tripartite motif-containing protein 56